MPALLVPASADTTRLSNSLVKLLKSELSVSEAAALQGLDKHFRFYGSLNAMQQMVANGVTAATARFCKSILSRLFFTARPTLSI